ncbi:hypothetical protein KIH27_20140 [Mycobacterium sp. M1]|uniref:DUF624 domain-containing protein n=1 Tax=Mycolicibacter acidiphilus TaxID=2835306 RepID=A0ABS5RQQ2_9MYCO|nr:hypothetical protein [Mycolicibacter acidiphilus]MBS9535898.1 hypothetical protein [Mycolicibacter acidiphilus]
MEFTFSFEWMGSLLTVFFVVPWLLSLVVAFPADALLIALCVTATDKAVRGESVRVSEVLAAARSRMSAVCRLTAAYYAWFVITEIVVYGVLAAAVLGIGPSALVLLAPINFAIFALGILFSLAPIVLVVEGRGVVDSFRRAWDLAKTAWPRLMGIHLLWALCVLPLIAIPMVVVMFTLGWLGVMIAFAAAFAFLLAYFRALQMLIYTDLRIRQERYDAELCEAWNRNTGAAR